MGARVRTPAPEAQAVSGARPRPANDVARPASAQPPRFAIVLVVMRTAAATHNQQRLLSGDLVNAEDCEAEDGSAAAAQRTEDRAQITALPDVVKQWPGVAVARRATDEMAMVARV